MRDNSQFGAFLITRDGRRIDSPPLNCELVFYDTEQEIVYHPLIGLPDYSPVTQSPKKRGYGNCHGIPNNTQRTFEWSEKQFGPGVVIHPSDVYRLGIAFRSGGKQFDTGDNWNLDQLEVYYVVEVESKTSPAGTFSIPNTSARQ